MTTLLLIRHGESIANRQSFFAGQIDPDLEEKGLQQAKLTARYIAENYQVDAIYASDLTRARKTAECLGEIIQLPIIKEPELREINAGQWEGVSFPDLRSKFSDDFALWIEHIGRSRCTGGEAVSELGERIMKILTRIANTHENQTVAVFTHATPIKTVQSIVRTGNMDAMEHIPWVSNASVTIVTYDGTNWALVAESIDDHLLGVKTALPDDV